MLCVFDFAPFCPLRGSFNLNIQPAILYRFCYPAESLGRTNRKVPPLGWWRCNLLLISITWLFPVDTWLAGKLFFPDLRVLTGKDNLPTFSRLAQSLREQQPDTSLCHGHTPSQHSNSFKQKCCRHSQGTAMFGPGFEPGFFFHGLCRHPLPMVSYPFLGAVLDLGFFLGASYMVCPYD